MKPVAWLSKKHVVVDGLWETEEWLSMVDDGGAPLYERSDEETISLLLEKLKGAANYIDVLGGVSQPYRIAIAHVENN